MRIVCNLNDVWTVWWKDSFHSSWKISFIKSISSALILKYSCVMRPSREYWMNYRGRTICDLFLAHPLPLLPSASCLSFSAFLCVAGRAYWRERGWEVVGMESNHTTARKPGHLWLIHYSLHQSTYYLPRLRSSNEDKKTTTLMAHGFRQLIQPKWPPSLPLSHSFFFLCSSWQVRIARTPWSWSSRQN